MKKTFFYLFLAVFFVAAVASCKGPEGPQGIQGPPGPEGPIGPAGKNGSVIKIGTDGYWYIDDVKTQYKASTVPSVGNDGFWYIDGVKTEYKAGTLATIPREDMIVVAKLFNRLAASDLQYRVEVAQRLGANQFLIFPDQVMRDGCAEVLTNSGIDLWLIAPIMYNDDNQGTSASAQAFLEKLGRAPKWAMCDDGEIAQAADGAWPRWVCPNDIEYLDLRIESFKPALDACEFTGISLDFIRYFTHWENTRPWTDPRTLRNSCFCDVCMDEFINSSYIGSGALKPALEAAVAANAGPVEYAKIIYKDYNYRNRFTNYKVNKIDKTIEYILGKLEDYNLQSNIHAVPYAETDHNGAIKAVIGQDFGLLSRRVDQISPMTYNVMCARTPEWINYVAADIVTIINNRVPVVPTIQGNAGSITMDDYAQMISNAIKYPSSGIVIWQFERLADERIDVIDNVLNGK